MGLRWNSGHGTVCQGAVDKVEECVSAQTACSCERPVNPPTPLPMIKRRVKLIVQDAVSDLRCSQVMLAMSPWLGLMLVVTRVTCHLKPRARSHFQHQLPGEGSMMSVSREFSGSELKPVGILTLSSY